MPVMTGITVQNVAIAAEDLNGDYFEVVAGQVKPKPNPDEKTTVLTTDSVSYPVAASDRYIVVEAGATATKDLVFPQAGLVPNRIITVRMPTTMGSRQVTVKTATGSQMTMPGGEVNSAGVFFPSVVLDDRAVVEATWQATGSIWKLINWTERKYYPTKDYPVPAGATTFLSAGGVVPAAGAPFQIPNGSTAFASFDGNYQPLVKLPIANNATGRYSVYANNSGGFPLTIDRSGTDLPANAKVTGYTESMHFEWSAGLWRWVPAPEAPQGVSNQVAVQIGNPNITPPASIPAPVKGDIVVQTSDGTATGALQASYVWSGTAWVMQASNANATALASPSVRTYFTATTAFVDKFAAAETAATIAARGFTPVGAGAAAIPSTLGNYVNSFMITLQAPVAAQNAANIAAIFTPPTAYVRHEVAITAGVANSYFLKMRSSAVDTVADVWVCDPVTGAPVERLHGTGATRITASDQGTAFGLGPDESNAAWNREYEWVSWLIPATAVAARKTGTNTIKLAIKPAIGNGNGINIDISGYAMAAVGNSQYASTPVFALDNQINGGIQAPYGGVTTGNPYGILNAIAKIPAVPGGGLRIAIPDITKDTWVSLISHGNGYGSWARNVELTLVSTATGNTTIGRTRPHQVGPLLAAICAQSGLGTMNANGWLIPANVLAAKAVKPAGSAVWYLEVAIANVSDLAAYMAGWFAETVN
jgi:hypothetical protein